MTGDKNADGAENGPKGQGNYLVKQGDCLSSIAVRFGFTWQTLWNLPENTKLKTRRQCPNVLLPGDQLTIPPIRIKHLDAATDQRHNYVLKGVPARFVMRFLEDGEALVGEPYQLSVDGDWRNGTLDEDGLLTEFISPRAKTGTLIIGNGGEIPIRFGDLDPVQEISGVQGRLNNLGFSPGPIDGIWGARTEYALRGFQEAQNLLVTGKADDTTRNRLVALHGS